MKQVRELISVVSVALLFFNLNVAGQSPGDFGLRAVPQVVGEEGEPEVALGSDYTVVVKLFAAVEGVEGWSFGLCVDPTEQTVVEASPGADLNTLALGAPPEFSVIRVWSEEGTPQGVTQAVVLDIQGALVLGVIPPEEAVAVLSVQLRPKPESAGSNISTLFCDTLGKPPVETLFVVDNQGIVPGMLEGSTVTVVRDPPTLIAFEKDEYNLALSVGTMEVAVRVRSLLPLYGFSFGVTHDPNVLSLSEVKLHQDLLDTLGGVEPDFWAVNTSPAGGAGFTAGVVFDIPDPSQEPPPTELVSIKSSRGKPSTSVFQVRYEAGPQAQPGVTVLNFTDTLGDPPVAILFDVGSELVPNTRDASVRITQVPLTTPFRRGDINADGRYNISDAIAWLRFQFGGGKLGYDCNEALDVNDDGSLNVADAVYLLRYLFVSGDPPAAPFPDCGGVPPGAPGFIGCNSYTGCE